MKTKYLLLFIVFNLIMTLLSPYSYGINYYVSSSGNDGNDGLTQQTPWQSISKVNSRMNTFNPGNQILFKKGEKFIGTINITRSGASGNDIIFGSYGSGNPPIITGKKIINGWTVHSGNIYKANFSDSVSQLYVSGKLMTIARYPNVGFLKIDAGVGYNGFIDAELTQVPSYFNGANCRVRTINWSYETKQVLSSIGGTVTLTTSTQWLVGADYGYYFDNKLNLLDSEGEWFHDKSTNVIYLYAPNGVNPNTLTVEVEGVVYNHGFNFNLSLNYIKIRDLNISGYKGQGVEAYTDNNISIKKCLISNTGVFGVRLNGSNNIIDSNIFSDNLNVAIMGVLINGIISNNTIKRTGLIPGYGVDAWGYIGMQIHTSVSTIVEYNFIDSSGYIGLSSGKNMIIRNNIISYSCLTLNDGCGIDLTGADGLQIKNNVITNTIGNIESSSSSVRYAHGIGFGPGMTKNVLIQGNTIAFNRYDGIALDNKNSSDNNQILDNILYDNDHNQITVSDYAATTYSPSYNNTIKRNIFYSLSQDQNCMEQQMWHSSNFSDYGNFDSNYYCNPYSEFVVKRSITYIVYSSKTYRLPLWQSTTGEDPNSKYSQFSFEQFRVTDTLSNNLITNSRFTNDVNGWGYWPIGASITHTTHPLLDTGCMRFGWNGFGYGEGFALSNTWPVANGDYYLVNLNTAGNHSGDFNLWMVFDQPAYLTKFLGYENFRRNHTYFFKTGTTDMVHIQIGLILPDSLLYVDNVNAFKVSVEKIDSTQMSKLFINQTNSTQFISLSGITYKDLDGSPVTGSIMLQPFSSRILINDNSSTIRNLQLKTLIEGLYNPSTNLTRQDSITVYLRNSFSPYTIADSSKSIPNSAGDASVNFTNVINGQNYYIVIKHRNSLETWSSAAITFNPVTSSATYDFTTSSSQAYGNNMKLVDTSPIKYAIYSGDINIEGIIDASDLSLVDNDVFNSISGYVRTDVNGDNYVDASDLSIIDNNVFLGIILIRP